MLQLLKRMRQEAEERSCWTKVDDDNVVEMVQDDNVTDKEAAEPTHLLSQTAIVGECLPGLIPESLPIQALSPHNNLRTVWMPANFRDGCSNKQRRER